MLPKTLCPGLTLSIWDASVYLADLRVLSKKKMNLSADKSGGRCSLGLQSAGELIPVVKPETGEDEGDAP